MMSLSNIPITYFRLRHTFPPSSWLAHHQSPVALTSFGSLPFRRTFALCRLNNFYASSTFVYVVRTRCPTIFSGRHFLFLYALHCAPCGLVLGRSTRCMSKPRYVFSLLLTPPVRFGR